MLKKILRLSFYLFIFTLIFACKKKKTANATVKMQEFITEISVYAREFDSDFIIIPQNGAELVYINGEQENGVNSAFISQINAFGMEELYYNGGIEKDDYRINLLKTAGVKALVADFHNDNSAITNSYSYAAAEGWLAFPRTSDNYDYKNIPSFVYNENADNITNLNEAKNYLYLISTDNYSSKAAFLAAIQATNYDAIIIDAFYQDALFTSTEINALKVKANGAQRILIAYMSIGSAEKYRYYWQEKWRKGKPNWLKKKYDGYKDELWVEFWNPEWKSIIYGNEQSYTKKIIDAGFDGTYLDNVEAFYFLYHRK